jgi:phosphoserine phosphatase RsbX
MINWGVAGRPLPGETVSGDNYVAAVGEHTTLLSVIDGLGHGPEAAEASARAAEHIGANLDLSLVEMMTSCHKAIRKTRGVVAALVGIEEVTGKMTWLGVGNIEGRLVGRDPERPKETLLQRGGVVGYDLPKLMPRSIQLEDGDTIFLGTDGLNYGYHEIVMGADPQRSAQLILSRYAKPTDDALVLIASYHSMSGRDCCRL